MRYTFLKIHFCLNEIRFIANPNIIKTPIRILFKVINMEITFEEINIHDKNDPKVQEFHEFRKEIHDELTPQEYFADKDEFTRFKEDKDLIEKIYLIKEKESGKLLGSLEITTFNPEAPNYEMNKYYILGKINIKKEYRRKKIGSLALAFIYDYMMVHQKGILVMNSTHESGVKFFKGIGAEIAFEGIEDKLILEEIDWNKIERWYQEGKKELPDEQLVFYEEVPLEILRDYTRLFVNTNLNVNYDDLSLEEKFFAEQAIKEQIELLQSMDVNQMIFTLKNSTGETTAVLESYFLYSSEETIRQGFFGVLQDEKSEYREKFLRAIMLKHIKENLPNAKYFVMLRKDASASISDINQELGFKENLHSYSAQIDIEEIRKYLFDKGFISKEQL